MTFLGIDRTLYPSLSEIQFQASGTGAVQRDAQSKMRDIVDIMDFGAVADGVTDDRTALQNAVNTGKVVSLSNRSIAIGSQITWAQNGGGIIGPGSIVMLTGAGQFQETNVANKYDTDACAIYVIGFDDVTLERFKISLGGSPANDSICMAIALRDSERSSISWCEATNFRKADGIIALDSSFDCVVVFNSVHDCQANGATLGQLSGVNVDDTRIAGVNSQRCLFAYNVIESLTVDATFLAANGYQTDGINIQGAGSAGHTICGNRMDTVGEGVDCFSDNCTIYGNLIRNAYAAGIKLIHGASYNSVYGNVIDSLCKYGINLAGSSTAAQDTQYNSVFGNVIRNVNSASNHTASGVSAGVACDNSGTFKAKNNYIANNTILESSKAHWGLRIGTGAADGNECFDNRLYGTFATARVQNDTPANIMRSANKSHVRAGMVASAQTVSTGTLTTIVFDTETQDVNGEYDTATGIFTASEPRRVAVTAACRSSGGSVGNNWELYIVPTAGGSQRVAMNVANAGGEQLILISGIVELRVTDTLKIQFRHDKGADISLTNAADNTYLNISEL